MATYQHSNDIELFYNVYGNGNKVLIAFHGFTKDCTDYKLFENILGEKFVKEDISNIEERIFNNVQAYLVK